MGCLTSLRWRRLIAPRWILVSIVALVLTLGGRIGASNHAVHIKEVMVGANGSSKIQRDSHLLPTRIRVWLPAPR